MSVKGRLYYAHTFTRAQHNPYNAIAIPRDTTHNTLEASSVSDNRVDGGSGLWSNTIVCHVARPFMSHCPRVVWMVSYLSSSFQCPLTQLEPWLQQIHRFIDTPSRAAAPEWIQSHFPNNFPFLRHPLVAARLFRLSNLAIRWKVPRQHILQPAAVIQFNSSFDAPPRLSSALPCLPRNPCAEWADEYKVILCVLVILNRSIQISDKLQSIRNRLVMLYWWLDHSSPTL